MRQFQTVSLPLAFGVASMVALAALYAGLVHASHRAQGVAAFNEVAPVFQSPRCMNCHRSDLPRVREDGRDHVPRVRPASDGTGEGGERCTICHRDNNNPISRIPGAPHWKMPPYEMSWDGLEAADICANLKDRRFNGDRSLAEVLAHVEKDAVIAWAWTPGSDRSTPPVPFDAFKERLARWISLGAPCAD